MIIRLFKLIVCFFIMPLQISWSATLAHIVETSPYLDSLAALLGQLSSESSLQSVSRYNPEVNKNPLKKHILDKLVLGIIYKTAPIGAPLLITNSSKLSPYLSTAQKDFLIKAKNSLISSLSELNPVYIDSVPIMEVSMLATPSIVIYIPEDLNAASLFEPICNFLLDYIETRVELSNEQKVNDLPINNTQELEVISPKQSLAKVETDIRKEVLSWIALESDDESFMQAFEGFEIKNEPTQPDDLPKNSPFIPEQTSLLDDESIYNLTEQLYIMANKLKSSKAQEKSTPTSTQTSINDLDYTYEAPNWLIDQ